MHSSAVRCVLQRGRPDIAAARRSVPVCLRPFSTSQWLAEDKNDAKPPPTRRERSAAAASQLSSLPRSSPSSTPRPIDARSLSAARPPNAPNVISVRSLPKGPDGKPIFRRPLGLSGAAGGSKAPGGGSGPRPGFRPRFGPRAGGPRTGGPGGMKAGGGRGGMRGARGKPRRQAKKKDEGPAAALKDRKLSEEEQAYVDSMEQGVELPYKPSVSFETLVRHAPAVATSSKLAQIETAMKSMRLLGRGRPFVPDSYQSDPDAAMARYRRGEPAFLSQPDEEAWVREITAPKRAEPLEAASEITRKTIVDLSIKGKYVLPKSPSRSDVLGTLQSYHLRSSTYQVRDGQAFDAKVQSLLPTKAAGAGKGSKQKQARS
ncbi:hypothetical protein NKR23_g11995 [Pleurostoma richardsiae]|uniref:Uncharacterized protein n=1 Tax=Pleurostoma richardsiae TaxID=41990 RepID=A0AA38R2W3_9PEZI|nr:hypothetical protein NKR23_g11995 [Pleurostoma richardsiae]